MPRVLVLLIPFDVLEVGLAPAMSPADLLHDRCREDEELGVCRYTSTTLPPTVQANNHDEIRVEALDEEAGSTRLPSALDLNPRRAVPFRIISEEIGGYPESS